MKWALLLFLLPFLGNCAWDINFPLSSLSPPPVYLLCTDPQTGERKKWPICPTVRTARREIQTTGNFARKNATGG